MADPEDWFEGLPFADALARFESLEPEMTVGPEEKGADIEVWLRTERSFTEEYIVTLSVGQDYAVELSVDVALVYAVEVLHTVQLADYAQAITKQMFNLGTDPALTDDLLQDLLPQLLPPMTATDLRMQPAVNRKDGEPMLVVSFQGQKVGVWSLQQAREHAVGVLEATLAAKVDTAYFKMLTEIVELDANTAAAVVSDIGDHRWPS